MHGLVLNPFLAELAIPSARQCLLVASPFVIFFTARWLLARIDLVIAQLFPQWEWEKRLGWLNIGVERRANTVLRWIGHFVHALLAATLYGIVWGASFFSYLCRTDDPSAVASGMSRLSTLLLCLGVWVLYLGWELLPKLRAEYEREELEKFRAEMTELEEEHPLNPTARLSASQLAAWQKSVVRPQLERRR